MYILREVYSVRLFKHSSCTWYNLFEIWSWMKKNMRLKPWGWMAIGSSTTTSHQTTATALDYMFRLWYDKAKYVFQTGDTLQVHKQKHMWTLMTANTIILTLVEEHSIDAMYKTAREEADFGVLVSKPSSPLMALCQWGLAHWVLHSLMVNKQRSSLVLPLSSYSILIYRHLWSIRPHVYLSLWHFWFLSEFKFVTHVA